MHSSYYIIGSNEDNISESNEDEFLFESNDTNELIWFGNLIEKNRRQSIIDKIEKYV